MRIKILLVLGIILSFISCSEVEQNGQILTNKIEIPKNIDRIVSTAPSNTEILLGLGLVDKLIIVSEYDNDKLLEGKTKVKFDFIDIEFIIGQKPDIIIASEHNTSHGRDLFKNLEKFNIPVIFIPTARNIDDIYRDIKFISEITNTQNKADSIITYMKAKMEKIYAISTKIKNKKKVYFELDQWNGMLYSFGRGTFINEVVEDVGGENIFRDKKLWIKPSSESIILKNPDVIITNSVDTDLKKIYKRKGWENITAIKENKVFSVDADKSSRCSQNILHAYYEIANKIYPEEYEKIDLE